MAHGVTPEALRDGARERAATRAPRSSSRRPTTGWPPTSPACAEVAHARGRAARRRPAPGARTSASTRRCRRARCTQGADACSPRRTRSSARSPSPRCCTSAAAAGSTPTRSARARAAGALDQPDLAADGLARRARGASSPSTARRCWTRRSRRPARAREAIDDGPGMLDRWASELRRAARGRRLGPAADRDRRARDRLHRLRGRRRAARAPTTSTSSSRRTRRSCSSSGSDSRSTRCERLAARLRRDRQAHRRGPATAPALVAPAVGARATRRVISPREAFLGEAEAVPVDDAVGRISCESIAGYPPGVPALLPGERITAEVVAYLRELTLAGARLHGAATRSSTRSECSSNASATARSGGGARSTPASSPVPRRRAASRAGSARADWRSPPQTARSSYAAH